MTVGSWSRFTIWFKTEREIKKYTLQNIEPSVLRIAKEKGFSDFQIAHVMGNCTEDEVFDKRTALGIRRVYKMVDTCSAEFESPTNYFYSTFDGEKRVNRNGQEKSRCFRRWSE